MPELTTWYLEKQMNWELPIRSQSRRDCKDSLTCMTTGERIKRFNTSFPWKWLWRTFCTPKKQKQQKNRAWTTRNSFLQRLSTVTSSSFPVVFTRKTGCTNYSFLPGCNTWLLWPRCTWTLTKHQMVQKAKYFEGKLTELHSPDESHIPSCGRNISEGREWINK